MSFSCPFGPWGREREKKRKGAFWGFAAVSPLPQRGPFSSRSTVECESMRVCAYIHVMIAERDD